MLDTLKVRIYPNKGQQEALAKSFGCSRFVFNYYLNKTNNQYQETGKGMSYCDMAKDLTQLKKQNQVIIAENLCIKGLARTKLAKSILDAGWGMLLNFISYKLDREGGIFIQVDRFFPSTKLCNSCKVKNNSLNLSVREWVCPECKTHHDRDENATQNLWEEGIRILSNTVGHTEFQACGETVRLVGTSTKKQVSVKQESPVTA